MRTLKVNWYLGRSHSGINGGKGVPGTTGKVRAVQLLRRATKGLLIMSCTALKAEVLNELRILGFAFGLYLNSPNLTLSPSKRGRTSSNTIFWYVAITRALAFWKICSSVQVGLDALILCA